MRGLSAPCSGIRLVALFLSGLLAPTRASASFLAGEALDTMADVVALIVLFAVPIGAIAVFWLVHILPEVIAEKKHHPQKGAIKALCLLSLVFGGMLWPFAWIWAYTKPVGYRIAYGTDKHDDYFREMAHQARSGKLSREEIVRFKGELDDLAAGRKLPAELKGVRDDLEAVLTGAAQGSARGSGS
jgi:CBS domain containing-hemolysin-like protein